MFFVIDDITFEIGQMQRIVSKFWDFFVICSVTPHRQIWDSTFDTEAFCPRSPLDTLSSAAMSSSSSEKFSTDPGRGNGWW